MSSVYHTERRITHTYTWNKKVLTNTARYVPLFGLSRSLGAKSRKRATKSIEPFNGQPKASSRALRAYECGSCLHMVSCLRRAGLIR